jgi:Putative MetA-pathway of phenol degradation
MDARRVCRWTLAAVTAGAMIVAPAVLHAAGASVSYMGSIQVARGYYIFSQATTGLYVFNGLSLSSGRFTLTASVPLISQNTPYITYTSIGFLPSGGTESSSVSQRQGHETVVVPEVVEYKARGLGDPFITAGLTLVKDGGAMPSIQVTGQLKVPVADPDSGLGTGELDWAAGISLSKRMGRFFVFADAVYWTLGDLPDLDLQNAWAYGVSLGHSFRGGRYALLASYSAYSEVIAGVEPPSSLGLSLSIKVGGRSSLMLNSMFGLSESSPAVSFSLGWLIGL